MSKKERIEALEERMESAWNHLEGCKVKMDDLDFKISLVKDQIITLTDNLNKVIGAVNDLLKEEKE